MVIEAQIHAGFAHFLCQKLTNVMVKSSEKQVTSIALHHVGAQPGENARKFGSDISPSNDEQPFGETRQVKNLVGGEGELDTRDIGQSGPGASGE